MTLAVTTASGQLGQAIITALKALNTGEPIIGLARSPEKAGDLGIEIRPGDYDQPEQLASSLKGVESVLMVSGMAPPDARAVQHRNVIEAAKAAGVRKVVFTSVQGSPDTGFGEIIRSTRQTEEDLKQSCLNWVIGRNGLYIEPDVDYIDTYKAAGEIANCAGEGKAGYTTRAELGFAYARLLTSDVHNGKTYNLHGEALTQTQLAGLLNGAFGTSLTYRPITVADYKADRIAELGPFIGSVIAGIYEGIRAGEMDNPSDFEAASGRPHQSWGAFFN